MKTSNQASPTQCYTTTPQTLLHFLGVQQEKTLQDSNARTGAPKIKERKKEEKCSVSAVEKKWGTKLGPRFLDVLRAGSIDRSGP